ncbi:hypothetical protein OROMI_018974 [Orobanche minor]
MGCNSSEIGGDLSMSGGCMTGEVGVDQDDLSMSDLSVVNCPGREVMHKGKKYVFIGEPAEPIGCPTGLMPNAWRLLLGLQSLAETKGISISVGTLRRTYYPKQHDRIPTHWVGIFGESSTENIHEVPWLERKTKELLRAEVLARTSIWSTAIEKLGGTTSSFIEAFMEGSKKHTIFTAKEIYAMAKKKTKQIDSRVTPVIKRAPKGFLGEPGNDVSKIVMGEEAHLYLGHSAFSKSTGSLSLDDEVRQMGASEASNYAFLIEAQAVLLLNQNIITSEERHALQSARDAALQEKNLEFCLRKEKKMSSDSEQQLKVRVAHLESRIEE